jgi:hypothetical protein
MRSRYLVGQENDASESPGGNRDTSWGEQAELGYAIRSWIPKVIMHPLRDL